MTTDHNTTITSYNQEADEMLAFVHGDVNASHGPSGVEVKQAANDNQQLSFDFMQMAEAAVMMREGMKGGAAQ